MTNPTPHGQVPEALIDLIDAYAETRHRCGGIYNARTEAARKAVIEALSGVQALSAAPEIHEPKCPALDGAGCTCAKPDPTIDRAWAQFCGGIGDGLDAPYPGMISAFERYYSQSFADKAWRNEASVWAAAWKAALLAASPTPPAEQQAKDSYIKLLADCRDAFPVPEHGSPIENEWIAAVGSHEAVPVYLQAVAKQQAASKAAPESFLDGADVQDESGVLAYYSREAVLACINAALESVAAPKAAPGDVLDEALRERDDAEDFIDALLDEVLGHERPEWSSSYGRADALNDVQERMTALHKPAVDKAWGRFQSAMAAPGEPDGFGSAEHWKEKAQYWAGVAHRLRGEALRGEPVDGIVHPPAPQQEAQEPVGWDGAEEWEKLAWHLCAEENGEDACNELIWEGGPMPEPWGDRWLKYEGEARRMIALVRTHVPAPQPASVSSDTLYLLRRLLSNQHTLTGPELRAELEKIVGEAYQQEAQEPSKAYAWVYVNKYGVDSIPASKDWCAAMVSGHGGSMFPLYTAPQPAPAPLSDAQIKELIEDGVFLGNCKEIIRAIEHAHGITQKEDAS